jgi:nucleoporin NDC1
MASKPARRIPYKDVLTPALHHRFLTVGLIAIAIAYIEAVSLSNWDSCESWLSSCVSASAELTDASAVLWSWFPIGPTGIRAFFLVVAGVLVLVLRIHQNHVGLRTSDSAFQILLNHFLRFQTVETIATYILSAALFSQVYLWCVPEKRSMGWITYHTGDRARLNERAVFFTAHFLLLGFFHGLAHLYTDADCMLLGYVKPNDKVGKSGADIPRRFRDILPTICIDTMNRCLVCIILGFLFYTLLLRAAFWRLSLFFLRPLFYNLPKTNMMPTTWTFLSFWMFLRCLIASLMLVFMWTATNTAFTVFLVDQPLKDGKPLTTEVKDANGCLLNGLKSKKQKIQVRPIPKG